MMPGEHHENCPCWVCCGIRREDALRAEIAALKARVAELEAAILATYDEGLDCDEPLLSIALGLAAKRWEAQKARE